MLNAKNERELVYVTLIDGLEPIPGYDRVEQAIVGGWRVIVRKGQFQVGDPAIYFEIDSRVPSDRECFAFLEPRHYKIKTLKMCKTISSGLLMSASDFGWDWYIDEGKNIPYIYNSQTEERYYPDNESRFLTKQLGVTYADENDNQRKAPSVDKYKKMAARHPNIFKKPFVRWLMKHKFGRKIMFFFFGKKKDEKDSWPSWVQKTDEERVQNMPWILSDGGDWVATEKIDGTSTTFTIKRKKFGKKAFYVCSRNVCFDVDKPCYYDTNVYWEMAKKYNIFDVLSQMLNDNPTEDWITIQGETYGEGIQKRNYSRTDHDFMAFNLIFSSRGRVGTIEMKNTLEKYHVPCVPVVAECIKINQFQNVKEILAYADGNSQVDNKMREGIVFRSVDGTKSFKAVSNKFLLEYHS